MRFGSCKTSFERRLQSHKVACFIWLLAKESVLKHENLMKRGISFASNCCLCWTEAETVRHSLLH